MTRNLKISLALAGAFIVALAALLLTNRTTDDGDYVVGDRSAAIVRADSHRLSDVADGKVTFVEFLDFECEACGAMFPVVEQLRRDYGDRVNFVVRYFPLPSHFNAERAARAVEAAARQGQFEQMYKKMYETQSEWAEQRTPKDELFRGYASELGLEMTAFDSAYTDSATLDRIRIDVADGEALGVKGTPTFFVNGTQIKPRSYDDLTNALDAALG
ncbi:DsbA family protein [Antrihabitans sp. NCIMB 15449]|uniref:DsbA family protein n=1 Tax=Antrihabitans spumae TaxID=3373370 RepID=A0ABW7JU71_9NOCA